MSLKETFDQIKAEERIKVLELALSTSIARISEAIADFEEGNHDEGISTLKALIEG